VADMQNVVDRIRQQEGDALKSLQVVGFCYGGGVAAGMAAMERPVWSAVSAHPTWENHRRNTLGDLSARVNGSLFFIMPYEDPFFNNQAESWIRALLDRNIEANFRIFANSNHGFAFDFPRTAWNATMRANSIRDTLTWLGEHDERAR